MRSPLNNKHKRVDCMACVFIASHYCNCYILNFYGSPRTGWIIILNNKNKTSSGGGGQRKTEKMSRSSGCGQNSHVPYMAGLVNRPRSLLSGSFSVVLPMHGAQSHWLTFQGASSSFFKLKQDQEARCTKPTWCVNLLGSRMVKEAALLNIHSPLFSSDRAR